MIIVELDRPSLDARQMGHWQEHLVRLLREIHLAQEFPVTGIASQLTQ
jgi:hypothetical protein